jgi:hypothetical protein
VTAKVLEALHRVDGTADLGDDLSALEGSVGDFERRRPYVLCTVLECLAQLAPDSAFTQAVVHDLLAARAEYDQYLLWPEKVIDQDRLAAAASTVHTARAVRALAQIQAVRPSTELAGAVEQACDWLIDHAALENVSEILERPLDATVERTFIRHFTAAWVVKALVSAGLPASHPALSAAVAQVWRRYYDGFALWTYRNGDIPIWMTADAIDSLRLASLATIRASRTRENTGA